MQNVAMMQSIVFRMVMPFLRNAPVVWALCRARWRLASPPARILSPKNALCQSKILIITGNLVRSPLGSNLHQDKFPPKLHRRESPFSGDRPFEVIDPDLVSTTTWERPLLISARSPSQCTFAAQAPDRGLLLQPHQGTQRGLITFTLGMNSWLLLGAVHEGIVHYNIGSHFTPLQYIWVVYSLT